MNLREGIAKKLIRSLKAVAPIADILLSPFTLAAAIWFRLVRFWGFRKMPVTKRIFLKFGVFPVVDHYYEPLFDYRKIGKRNIKSYINFNDAVQVDLLKNLNYREELKRIPIKKISEIGFYFDNGSFEDKDASLYYSIIRRNKPSRIIEVGSGFSTLMALQAIKQNKQLDSNYVCDFTCVEPYEMPYLEKVEINLIRKKVEDLDAAVFTKLGSGDILFIGSSHIIRPGGDVTYLFLSILPTLASGVWIHVHDIFLPEEYPVAWLEHDFRMWNEQYLLEALLINNPNFEVICALNYLAINHPEEVTRAFPDTGRIDYKPGSFWIRKK